MSELGLEDDLEVFSLSDIEVDEISFVKSGANQAAHVVFWKSDEGGEPDPEDVAIGYTISRYGVSLPAAEAAVRQHFGKAEPTALQAMVDVDSTKSAESKLAAYSTASSRVMAEERANKLRQFNLSLTPEQALAMVYETNPQLYATELSASTLMTQRQTRMDHDKRRFG